MWGWVLFGVAAGLVAVIAVILAYDIGLAKGEILGKEGQRRCFVQWLRRPEVVNELSLEYVLTGAYHDGLVFAHDYLELYPPKEN